MIITTTPQIEGHPVKEYIGVVAGETIIGANFYKDFKASLSDFFGGRSGAYEKVLVKAREKATEEMNEEATKMGANAIIGVDYDYETIGEKNSMLMVSVTGTAVII